MENPLYLEDCYLKEWDAEVKSVSQGKFIVLDNTAFYPNMGGQPNDTGKMIAEDGKEYPVVFVGKFGENISHEIEGEGLKQGDKVHCVLDWDKRYTLMKMHTAAHVLSQVLFTETGAHTAGNQLDVEQSRIDFTLENYDVEKIKECIEKSNEVIAKGGKVKKSFMKREDALKIEGFAGPSPHLMKDLETLRVVEIEGVDSQPCGGTHLNDISEIGAIEFVKAKNKGKNNRRVYYKLKE